MMLFIHRIHPTLDGILLDILIPAHTYFSDCKKDLYLVYEDFAYYLLGLLAKLR